MENRHGDSSRGSPRDSAALATPVVAARITQTAATQQALVQVLSDILADALVADFLADYVAKPTATVDSPGGTNHGSERV